MGILGKLFDKKQCDICGGDIGLLGNRKLEDGNLCKDCAKKLSPFTTDRRQSTVEEIKNHLRYREENEKLLGSIQPTKVIGADTKVYIDEAKKKFFVTRATDWRGGNPDIIDISQVSSCNVQIKEDKTELFRQDEEGKRQSYSPPRHEVSYRFMAEILVNSPWFSQIEFELTYDRPDSPYTEAYRDYERQANDLMRALDPDGQHTPLTSPVSANSGAAGNRGVNAPPKATASANSGTAGDRGVSAPPAQESWTCECGTQNKGRFCADCGAQKPLKKLHYRCDKCGFEPEDQANPPRFCPQCGDAFGAGDIV